MASELHGGSNYDMCPSNTPGVRTKRDDLSTIMTASGHAILDHTRAPRRGIYGTRMIELKQEHPKQAETSQLVNKKTTDGLWTGN